MHGCGILFVQNAENYSIPLLLLYFELLALEERTPPLFPPLQLLPLPPAFLEGANNGKGISPGGRALQKPLRWRWHRHRLHVAASLKTLLKSCACQYHEKNILCSFVTPVPTHRKQATRHVPEVSNKQIKLFFSWSVLPNCISDEVHKLVCGLNTSGNILLWAYFFTAFKKHSWLKLVCLEITLKFMWGLFLLLFYNVLSN